MTQWQYGELVVEVPRTHWPFLLRGVVISFNAGGRVTEFSSKESAFYTLGNQGWDMIGQFATQDENWQVTTYTFRRTAEQAAAAYEQERQERERHEKRQREQQQRRAEQQIERPEKLLQNSVQTKHPDLKTMLITTLSMLIAIIIFIGISPYFSPTILARGFRLTPLVIIGLGLYTRYREDGRGRAIFLGLIDSVAGVIFGYLLGVFFIIILAIEGIGQ